MDHKSKLDEVERLTARYDQLFADFKTLISRQRSIGPPMANESRPTVNFDADARRMTQELRELAVSLLFARSVAGMG